MIHSFYLAYTTCSHKKEPNNNVKYDDEEGRID